MRIAALLEHFFFVADCIAGLWSAVCAVQLSTDQAGAAKHMFTELLITPLRD